MNYLASPPLCVAYALAGRMDVDITREPLQRDVRLSDIWPSQREVAEAIEQAIESDMFRKSYSEVFAGDENWNALDVPAGDRAWDRASTYVKRPPVLRGHAVRAWGRLRRAQGRPSDRGTRRQRYDGPHLTGGRDPLNSPAGRYLVGHGVQRRDFNSYGSRRGNYEVMMRGTFANIRLRNQLAPGTEGGVTRWDGQETTIYEAAMAAGEQSVPLCVLAG
jgi:aconitate hydratase